jgi:hypothetical protein
MTLCNLSPAFENASTENCSSKNRTSQDLLETYHLVRGLVILHVLRSFRIAPSFGYFVAHGKSDARHYKLRSIFLTCLNFVGDVLPLENTLQRWGLRMTGENMILADIYVASEDVQHSPLGVIRFLWLAMSLAFTPIS